MTCTIPGCENPCEGTLWICATHNHERRRVLKNESKVKVVKPIPKMSSRKAKEVPEYSKLKKAFLEEKMKCEFNFNGCYVLATQIHHCSKSDKNFLNTATWKRSCAHCHPIAEALPAEERRAKGWLTD